MPLKIFVTGWMLLGFFHEFHDWNQFAGAWGCGGERFSSPCSLAAMAGGLARGGAGALVAWIAIAGGVARGTGYRVVGCGPVAARGFWLGDGNDGLHGGGTDNQVDS